MFNFINSHFILGFIIVHLKMQKTMQISLFLQMWNNRIDWIIFFNDYIELIFLFYNYILELLMNYNIVYPPVIFWLFKKIFFFFNYALLVFILLYGQCQVSYKYYIMLDSAVTKPFIVVFNHIWLTRPFQIY